MSKIQKVAITDARLMQEEPAYAVQKGALSVSVAPFSAIAASSSQMTFQVLVPSLNVFIDRKILLATPLSFNAGVYFGGARGASYRAIYTAQPPAATVASGVANFLTATCGTNGAGLVVATTQATAIADWNAQILAGQPPSIIGPNFAPGTVMRSAAEGGGNGLIQLTFYPATISTTTATSLFIIASYVLYDVPDPKLSSSQAAGPQYGLDMGQSLSSGGLPSALSGWCSAVSGKDLALTQFPIQSCLSTMTATLNDCTVTTNGDTLREQLMLTSTRENLKQRTTPTNADVFSWGRDDVQNGAGNFSTYSTANGYGDIANGAWPIAWSINPTCATQLQATAATNILAPGVGTTAIWPFLAAGQVKSFFQTTALGAGTSTDGGVGFYIAAAAADNVTVPTTPAYSSPSVLVPFLNFQPVWTCGFPGGDLLGGTAGANNAFTTGTHGSFTITTGGVATLTLLVSVPPMSMVGARLYDALAGNYSTSLPPAGTAAANGPTNGVIAIVTSLIRGGLGEAGSTYGLTYSSASTATITLVSAVAPTGNILALSGGCPVGYSLPVYGTISCAEALVISPLIWADSAEFQTVGLYGMTNMQFVLNFSPLGTTKAVLSPSVVTAGTLSGNDSRAKASLPLWLDDLTVQNPNTGNIIRSSNVRSVVSGVKYAAASGSSGPWAGGPVSIATTTGTSPTLYATFLTPGVDVPLPEVSTVPYVEFPRYFYTTGQNLGSSAPSINSQTISLTSIPDMVMIYVKPNTRGPSQLDQYLPIKSLSVTFDNFSNLCSSFQQVNLYESAVAAGLDMDWHQWRGFTQAQYNSGVLGGTAATAAVGYTKQSPFTQLSGGPILLRMGMDITLQPGLAPGCLGNYSFQVNCTIDNSKGYYDYVNNPVITVVAINTGFFETMRGQSAIRKTILQMADVAAATSDSGMSKTSLNRMIGRGSGGSMFSGASNLVSRGLAGLRQAKNINDQYGLTNLARTYGGTTGSQLADAADMAMNTGSKIDSIYGSGKRHRSSGIM
jgi:hypothetical protein